MSQSNDVRSQVEQITGEFSVRMHQWDGNEDTNPIEWLDDQIVNLIEQSNREALEAVSNDIEKYNMDNPKTDIDMGWQSALFEVQQDVLERIAELQHPETDPTETPEFKEAVEKGTKAWQGINPSVWVEKERGNTEGGSDENTS